MRTAVVGVSLLGEREEAGEGHEDAGPQSGMVPLDLLEVARPGGPEPGGIVGVRVVAAEGELACRGTRSDVRSGPPASRTRRRTRPRCGVSRTARDPRQGSTRSDPAGRRASRRGPANGRPVVARGPGAPGARGRAGPRAGRAGADAGSSSCLHGPWGPRGLRGRRTLERTGLPPLEPLSQRAGAEHSALWPSSGRPRYSSAAGEAVPGMPAPGPSRASPRREGPGMAVTISIVTREDIHA